MKQLVRIAEQPELPAKGGHLGQDRSQSRATNAHAEGINKQRVEQRVQ